MARIHDLIRQVADQSPDLAHELEREVGVLSERRAFGLNFERHTPEEVELPGRPVRRGDKVHVLPPRGEAPKAANALMWVVEGIDRAAETATVGRVDPKGTVETQDVALVDLVVVAEFRDPIYPGLVSTGKIERGSDKPYHSLINAENFHALQTLTLTHRGKVDAIYIDPPYNSRASDWKYNNNYVDPGDLYQHSKWLAFMERRLLLAKELLNPEDSVLVATIDEKEYLRLGLLLEQMFPSARIQMVSVIINPKGTGRANEFSRIEEYVFFVWIGAAQLGRVADDMISDRDYSAETEVRWRGLARTGRKGLRANNPGSWYPIYIDQATLRIHSIGNTLAIGATYDESLTPAGTVAAWPPSAGRDQYSWSVVPETLRQIQARGGLKLGQVKLEKSQFPLYYLTVNAFEKIATGALEVVGKDIDGVLQLQHAAGAREVDPRSVWNRVAHDAGEHGTKLLQKLIPGRAFPFPKSLFLVEDTLRFFVRHKREATVVDFFSGSGTTAHAVMRLNKQDDGRRTSISITNNEVSADEQKVLRERGLRPGDPDWEQWGICEYITKPRLEAAITGKTPDDEPIRGDYKFTDVFPMEDGFAENVEFFTLTYEAPLRVASHRDFPKVAPLLWLRAGSTGRRIDSLDAGWDVADTYGVLADLDKSDEFVTAVVAAPGVRVAFVITDEDRLFEAIVRDLPDHVEPVRMYDAYLRNFELECRVPR